MRVLLYFKLFSFLKAVQKVKNIIVRTLLQNQHCLKSIKSYDVKLAKNLANLILSLATVLLLPLLSSFS